MGTTSRNAVYTYQNLKASLTANTHGEDYYDLEGTITIATPSEILISSDKELTDANLKLRYSLDGTDKGEVSTGTTTYTKADGKLALARYSDITINDVGNEISLTVQDVKDAIAKGTNITKTVTIVWSVYDNKSKGYVADEELNAAEAIVSVTETVTISIDPYTVTFTKTGSGENVWTPSDALTYKATLVPATPTEENKTTEENKKDDVPKTGEVIYIRRRQRKRRNSKICHLGSDGK